MIALTGTPGTGKSSVSKLLRKKYKVLALGRIITKYKLYSRYDKKRETYVASLGKIAEFLRKHAMDKPDLIIDSHLAHLLPKNMIDLVIVLRCEPNMLEKRLKKKGWKKEKVQENKEAELIGVISFEARQKHKKVYEIDTSKKSLKEIYSIIQMILNGKGGKYNRVVNWLR